MRRAAVVVAVVAATTLGACSGDDDDAAQEPSSVATPVSTASTTVRVTTTQPRPSTSVRTSVTSATTSTSSTSTSSTTPVSTTTSPARGLVLRDDGLGGALFGSEPEGVIAYVSALLGPPSGDSGWVEAFSEFGTCSGTEVRGVSWADLQLLFGDTSWVTSGARHFFAYNYGPARADQLQPAGLRTDTGVAVDSSVAELRAAYPSVQLFPGEEGLVPPSFFVSEVLGGYITGTADGDTVTSILGGVGCGE